ncbi:MAG: hypothetical protein H0X72_11380 [Acidobacteria bacterium]|jgi:hypothetical protein|nr:hypothetical protein [Acidobacteriota bacterium]
MNNFIKLICIGSLLISSGCQRSDFQSPTAAPATLHDVPALRLNFRFETDVPAPTVNQPAQTEERNVAVQADFDQNRTQETLDKTLTSPDKQRVLAIYHRTGDLPSEFRLDMYSADGKLLRRITYDGMAIHFAETIVWSPDSNTVAFVAMIRANQSNPLPLPPTPAENQANTNSEANTEANVINTNADANVNGNVVAPTASPAIEAPKVVLTFRTEQIYICNREGAEIKPITQNEGLIYFYFVWSPDSSALAALAATYQEWNFLQYQAESKSELFTPAGRPRLVEKTGRERRLDDNLTIVRPVWSPDSAKIAVAFDKQVRIYDAIGDAPTQAAIPLRNQLLISSKAFDENLQRQLEGAENRNAPANTGQETATLPDENSLVSFNPIINFEWTADELLYLQTGYIKQMKNETDSARSYLRWHRLIFSPQASLINQK